MCFWAPKPPLFYHFWVNWGAPKHPPKYFLGYFHLFIILFGLSAFQNFFTFHFTMILRDFMIFLKLFAFFGKNLGILLNKNVFSVPNRNRYWATLETNFFNFSFFHYYNNSIPHTWEAAPMSQKKFCYFKPPYLRYQHSTSWTKTFWWTGRSVRSWRPNRTLRRTSTLTAGAALLLHSALETASAYKTTLQ